MNNEYERRKKEQDAFKESFCTEHGQGAWHKDKHIGISHYTIDLQASRDLRDNLKLYIKNRAKMMSSS